jgi:hypothetical protein
MAGANTRSTVAFGHGAFGPFAAELLHAAERPQLGFGDLGRCRRGRPLMLVFGARRS